MISLPLLAHPVSLVTLAKCIWALGVVSWYLLRLPFELKVRRTRVADATHRTLREYTLLTISTLGLGIVPAVFCLTSWPRGLTYATFAASGDGGRARVPRCALAVLAHPPRPRAQLVGDAGDQGNPPAHHHGVYRAVRHPMYSAFFLWAVAQALLLPNLIAGLSGLIGFGILFAFRVGARSR